MNHLEIEFKSLLTKDEFQTLLPLFSKALGVRQTNHYFDTPDWSLRNNGASLRVRTFLHGTELTLKISQKIGNMEYNQDLTAKESQAIFTKKQFPKGEIAQLLTEKGIQLENLNLLGSLTTIRHEMQTDLGLLALDENHYFDITDYELELEVQKTDTKEQEFQQFLTHHGIDYKPSKSKIARFAQNL